MKNFLIIFTAVCILGCQTEKSKSSDDMPSRLVLISSGQFEKGKTINMDGFVFDIVLGEDSDTIYLATTDTNFITSDGFRVGTEFGQIPDQLREKIEKENGWGYYIALNSRWNLGFCEGSSCTDNYPIETSIVKWLFKRQ